ncbi:MAG: glycine C-acetyltransferase, partial [Ignavibacteriales bacterium]|nr:glycine C-acetyltransferase [Ignavibacteriales bacterium]
MLSVPELITRELKQLRDLKTFKYETAFESPQSGRVKIKGKEVIMLASNNYLGLSNHPKVKQAAIEGIKKYGYGVASVRFICGTQDIHYELEKTISKFVGTEDAILFSSCFAANEGFFASLINEKLGFENYKDVLYSDKLNHASIIDGQRLCKSEVVDKKIYNHGDMNHLEQLLSEDKNANYRFKIVVTDGVFSMEGDLANLHKIVELAKVYGAMVFVDDSHAIGVCGKRGRGTPEVKGVLKKIDVITGTLGKAIGGAAGGYIASSKEIVSYLRQKSRPYTFSNSLPPSIVFGAKAAFELLSNDTSLVTKLHENTAYFRTEIVKLGFKILEGEHPIVPIMLGEAALAQDMSALLLKK